MPNVPKPAVIRDRPKPRRPKGQRAGQFLSRADNKRAEAINARLTIAQLDAVPADDRPSDWEEVREEAQKAVDLAEDQAKAVTAHAEGILGRKVGKTELKERKAAVLKAQADILERNLTSWDQTVDDHEANLAELEAVPQAARDEEWSRDHDSNVAALKKYAQSIPAAQTLLDDIKADPEYDPNAKPVATVADEPAEAPKP